MASTGKTKKRTTLAYARNLLATPLAGVATILYVMWQLVVEQQLFLHTFLIERIGKRGVAKLPLGYGNVLALKSIMLCQHLSHNPDLLRDVRRRREVLTIFLVPLSKACTTVLGNRSASLVRVQSSEAFSTNPRSTHGMERLTCSR